MLFLSEFRGVAEDPDLQQKGFRLQYGLKGKGNFIENYIVLTYNNEFCELLFQASHGIGLYALYYFPRKKPKSNWWFPPFKYFPLENHANPKWLTRNNLTDKFVIQTHINEYVSAQVLEWRILMLITLFFLWK